MYHWIYRGRGVTRRGEGRRTVKLTGPRLGDGDHAEKQRAYMDQKDRRIIFTPFHRNTPRSLDPESLDGRGSGHPLLTALLESGSSQIFEAIQGMLTACEAQAHCPANFPSAPPPVPRCLVIGCVSLSEGGSSSPSRVLDFLVGL